jgi:hypothetical protein
MRLRFTPSVTSAPPGPRKHRIRKQAAGQGSPRLAGLERYGPGSIAGATTQTTTDITWSPNDSVAFAQQTDQLWQALNAAAVQSSGTGTAGQSQASSTQLSGQELVNFINDYEGWSAFYSGALDSAFAPAILWWNTDTISSYQGKAAGWYNIIQALNPNATLPTLSPATGELSFMPSKGTVLFLGAVALAVGGVWFAWPWLSKIRGGATRRSNPRARRRRRR